MNILYELLPSMDTKDLNSAEEALSTFTAAFCCDSEVYSEADTVSGKLVKALVLLVGRWVDTSGQSKEYSSIGAKARVPSVPVLEPSESLVGASSGAYPCVAETVSLLRTLLHTPSWSFEVEGVLKRCLAAARRAQAQAQGHVEGDSLPSLSRLHMLLGSLTVLGGLAEALYVGGPIYIRGEHMHAGRDCVLVSRSDQDSVQYTVCDYTSNSSPGSNVSRSNNSNSGKVHSVHVDYVEPAGRFPAKNLQVLSGLLCLLYTSPSPRDLSTSRMPSSA